MDILHVFGIRSCRSCCAGNSSIRKNGNMQQQLNSDVLHKENGKKMVYILSCHSEKWQTDGTLNIVSGKPPVLCTVADNSLWEYRIKLIE